MVLAFRGDPLLAFTYLVEVDGLTAAGFNEVLGLQAELEVLEYREGGVNEFLHRLPGPVRHPQNVTLRRGMTDSTELWDWWQASARRSIQRRNASILLRGVGGEVARRWDLIGAYPVRWLGPDLRAQVPAVAIEALELAHRGFA